MRRTEYANNSPAKLQHWLCLRGRWLRLRVVQLIDLLGENLARSRGFEPLTAWFVERIKALKSA